VDIDTRIEKKPVEKPHQLLFFTTLRYLRIESRSVLLW